MKFKNIGAEIFIPDNKPIEEAFSRTTCMAISAHQDDIEFMAYDGILKCFGSEKEWFNAVVVTNGAGSSRTGLYKSYSEEQMQAVRTKEQKKAAFLGEYGALALLNYASSDAKDPGNIDIVNELKELIAIAKPQIIYTHNLADKHDTHLGVAVKVIAALRRLDESQRPDKLYGCEVWRSLDWVNDEEKVIFDVSAHSNIASSLNGVFDSQISAGKRYDLAVTGRRLANATFSASHGVDACASVIYGMDLTPLIKDVNMDINQYVQGYINRFASDVSEKLKKVL